MPSADSYERLILDAKSDTAPPKQPKSAVKGERDFLEENPTLTTRFMDLVGKGAGAIIDLGKDILGKEDPTPIDPVVALANERRDMARHNPIRQQRTAELAVVGLAAYPQLTNNQAQAVANILAEWADNDPELDQLIQNDFQAAMVEAQEGIVGLEQRPTAQLFTEALNIVTEIETTQRAQERQRRLDDIYAQARGGVEISAAVLGSSQVELDNFNLQRAGAAAKLLLLNPSTLIRPDRWADLGKEAATEGVLTSDEEQAIRDQQTEFVTPNHAAAVLAQAIAEQRGVSTASVASDALTLFNNMSADDQQQLRKDIAQFTADQIIEQAEEEGDPFTSSIEREIGRGLNTLTNILSVWDGVAQAIAVEVVTAAEDLIENFPGIDEGLFEGETRPTVVDQMLQGDWEAANASFQQLIDEGAAGWFGADGAAAAWGNLAAGIFADPVDWVTAGAFGRGKDIAKQLAKNPDAVLESRPMRSLIRQAAETSDDPFLITMLGPGLSPRAKLRILDTSSTDEIASILRDELVNGTYIPDPTIVLQRRHTALGLAQMGRNIDDPKIRSFAIDYLQRQKYDRYIDLGEANILDQVEELILFRFADDKDAAAAALRDFYRVMEEHIGGQEIARTELTQRLADTLEEAAQLDELAGTDIRNYPYVQDISQGLNPAEFRGDVTTLSDETMDLIGDEADRINRLVDTQLAKADEARQVLDDMAMVEIDGQALADMSDDELDDLITGLAEGDQLFHGSYAGEVSDATVAAQSDVGFFATPDVELARQFADGTIMRDVPEGAGRLFSMDKPDDYLDMIDDADSNRTVVSNLRRWLDEQTPLAETAEQVQHLDAIRSSVDEMETWIDEGELDVLHQLQRQVAYSAGDYQAGRHSVNVYPDRQMVGVTPNQEATDFFWNEIADGNDVIRIMDDGSETWLFRTTPPVVPDDELSAAVRSMGLRQTERGRLAAANRAQDKLNALDTWREEVEPIFNDWQTRRATAAQNLEEIDRLQKELERIRDRKDLMNWVDDFYNDWAENIDVPLRPDGEFDWKQLRAGGKKIEVQQGERIGELDRLDAVAMDAEHKKILQAGGLLANGSKYGLPATATEMALWASTQDKGTLRTLLSAAAKPPREALSLMNRVFAAAVLLNPVTPIRSAMDEVVRAGQETGSVRMFFDALMATFRDQTTNPRALAYGREVINPLTHTGSGWDWIEPNERGWFAAAERWMNGTIGNDSAVREFARAWRTGDRSGFFKWWDDFRGQEQRGIAISLTPGASPSPKVISSEDAWTAIDKVFDVITAEAKDPTYLKRALIEALSTGEDVPPALIRQLGKVPHQYKGSQGVTGKLFDVLYGRPSQRRGAVLFDYYYEYARNILAERFDGRILDDQLELLIDAGVARDAAHARQLFEARAPIVDETIRKYGMMTKGMIDSQASAYAARRADDIMYVLAGTSRLGRDAQLIMPFGPAQFDFYAWWAREMTRTTQMVMPFSTLAGSAGRRLPGALGDALQGYASLSATVPLPLNLRLLSRISHFPVGAARDDDPDRFEPTEPYDLLDMFTFLPVKWDPQNFLLDFGPGLGPLPSWAVGSLPTDHPIRQTLESFLPSLEFIEGQNGDPRKYFLPGTSRSIPGMTLMLERGAAALDGGDGIVSTMFRELNNSLFALESKPYGYSDYLKSEIGNILKEDPFFNPDRNPEAIQAIAESAYSSASGEEGLDRLSAQFGWRPRYGGDGLDPTLYFGVVDSLDLLLEQGQIGEPQYDELRQLREQIISDPSDLDAKRFFAEQARELVFGLDDPWQDIVIVQNPEVVANLVSTVQCAYDSRGLPVGPAEYCRPDGTVNFSIMPAGKEGDDLRAKGAQEGWWGPRNDAEIVRDATYRLASARTRIMSQVWEGITGKPWRGNGSSLSKETANTNFTISDRGMEYFGLAGANITQRTMTGQQLANVIAAARESLPREPELTSSDINPMNQLLAANPDLIPFRNRIKQIEKDAREAGFDSKFDWPEEAKSAMRDLFSEAAMVDPEILQHYPTTMQRYFGPLDWEPVEPPDVDQLDISWQASPQQVTVIDGDTIRVQTARGDLRVRVIGINAPEQGQAGYLESRDSLRAALDDTQEIVFGLYRPELFGTSQKVSPDGSEKRLIAWVYLDGVPYYDPASFTATNPAGIDVGGNPVDVVRLLQQRREERLNNGTE